MRFSILALSASIIGTAMAQVISVNVTHPVAGDAWVAGKSATISWVANVPTVQNVTVELFHGEPTHQTLVQLLGSGVKQLKIIAPNVPADWYSVRINQDSYSHYFFISNATVLTPTAPEPGTATTTTALPVPTSTTVATTANATTSAPTQTPTKASAGNSLAAGSLAIGAAVAAAILAL
ncbi:hypothetical protein BGZ76_004836 [Entomortierella beljakovae]|nr:hypothetical protein BGZ76_004836 [Entomortierella beljakovae]